MASVNISIKKEAYEFLKEIKTREQSFSDAILSLRKESNIMNFFGILKDKDWDKREKEMRSLRKEFER